MTSPLPKRRVRQRMNANPPTRVECEGHCGFVRRKYLCCLAGKAPTPCSSRIVAHHLQSFRASEGGMGMKVGDHRVIPLCDDHHIPYIHQHGQEHVEKECGIKLEPVAAACWDDDSYHRTKYEREWREEWPGVPLPYGDAK